MVLIKRTTNRRYRCGGSLINQNFVLSAAHCFCITDDPVNSCHEKNGRMVVDYSPSNIKLYLGVNNINIEKKGWKRFKNINKKTAIRIIIHRNWKGHSYDVDKSSVPDLALIKMSTVKYTKGIVEPICFPTPGTQWAAS